MDWDKLKKEEDDLVNNFKNMSDDQLICKYTIYRKKSHTQRPEGMFYDRQTILIDIELQDRGYRQYLVWRKTEEKLLCDGCMNEFNSHELTEYTSHHNPPHIKELYCDKCVKETEEEEEKGDN